MANARRYDRESHLPESYRRRPNPTDPIQLSLQASYVENVLVPTLKPGDIVILDNLGSHKNKAARRAIRAVGARLLFLPKYSPDLNPIEQLFAKLKHFLRKAARRTRGALCDVVGEILRNVTCDECRNYLVNSGYGRT